MKNVAYILMVVLIYSCGSLKIEQTNMEGEYFKIETNKNALSISYNLILNSDNTFSLSIKMQDANPKCNGQWKLIDKYIYLKCKEIEDVVEIFSSGYMKEKNYKLEVINSNKIKFKDVVLKRK